MKHWWKNPVLFCAGASLMAFADLASPPGALAQTTTYLVLMVTGSDGKVSHKAMAEKDQESFRKTLDAEFQKAKKAYQEEKKAQQKEKPGQKFDKPEPQKPKVAIVKRDLKTFNEAVKVAFDLDKNHEKGKNGKDSKNGKTQKKGNGS